MRRRSDEHSFDFRSLLDRVNAGERLTADEIAQLVATPDILPLGMLADALRRRLHGTRVTYLRVAVCAFERVVHRHGSAAPHARCGSPARRSRLTWRVTAVEQREGAWPATASCPAFPGRHRRRRPGDGTSIARVRGAAARGRARAIAELPLDGIDEPAAVIEQLGGAGYRQLRLTVDKAPAGRAHRPASPRRPSSSAASAASRRSTRCRRCSTPSVRRPATTT